MGSPVRARSLKPGVFKNELLGGADPLLTILFEGLWCMADREGRLEASAPAHLAPRSSPYRLIVTEKRAHTMLSWLHDNGFIVRYELSQKRYIQVIEFLKHQRPHSNEAPSIIQPLTSTSGIPRSAASITKVDSGHKQVEQVLRSDSPLL